MQSQCSHYHNGGGGGSIFPVRALTAYNFLRSYNQFLTPHQAPELDVSKYRLPLFAGDLTFTQSPDLASIHHLNSEKPALPIKPHNSSTVFPLAYRGVDNFYPSSERCSNYAIPSPSKRQRGEKRPIPDDQKDDKYYERRRRNNQAAKKSRDARKLREDQVALKATILEHENALLKAQIITLREESSSLRQLLLQKKTLELDVNEKNVLSGR